VSSGPPPSVRTSLSDCFQTSPGIPPQRNTPKVAPSPPLLPTSTGFYAESLVTSCPLLSSGASAHSPDQWHDQMQTPGARIRAPRHIASVFSPRWDPKGLVLHSLRTCNAYPAPSLFFPYAIQNNQSTSYEQGDCRLSCCFGEHPPPFPQMKDYPLCPVDSLTMQPFPLLLRSVFLPPFTSPCLFIFFVPSRLIPADLLPRRQAFEVLLSSW